MSTQEVKPMNIYQKLQKCRVGLQKCKLKMTGRNKFSDYSYYELGDFLPYINELMDANGLTAIFKYTTEFASLTIINTENTAETIVFDTPVEVTQLKGCNGMQNIGGTQTFARRYLYIMAFEISEVDIVNNGEVDEDEQLKHKKIDHIKVQTIRDMIKKTNSDEKGFLNFYKIKTVEDMTNIVFVKAMDTLQQKLDKMDKNKNQEDLGI